MRDWARLTILAVGFALLFSTHSLADDFPTERGGVEFRQISDNVWMHTSYRNFPNYGPVPANGLVVLDGTGAVLIDSGWTNADAMAVLDWAKHDAGLEITGAIFTHSHTDKMGGVEAIRTRGIATFASELSNRLAIEDGMMPAESSLKLDNGSKIQVFGPVALYFPGPGHSPDNIVVNIKSDGVLFGGCLVRPAKSGLLGNTNDADIANWSKAVENAAAAFPKSEIVVPTHGPPACRELLDLTAQLARDAIE